MPETSLSAAQLISVLQQSGLVEDVAVTELLERQGVSVESATAEQLAELLVQANLVTAWHASKLLRGKHKGFFLGKYKLLRLLGRGGMSSVYLAEHKVMKRRTAIKVLPYKMVADSSYLPRFYREAQAVAALDHPNIVRAYDVDHVTDGDMQIHFLVMEYVDGLNFFDLVKQQGPLDPQTAADYICQGARGLQHAHESGMVHRDIKPGNFIVDRQGTVKLMDLGLAIVREENDSQEESITIINEEKVLGTADYLAPEQAVDSHLVDSRADIYALGCTFYYLLTGRAPFEEGTLAQRLLAHQTKQPTPIQEYRDDVPESLIEIIDQMMVKDLEQRTQTAAEVVRQLTDWKRKCQSSGAAQPTSPLNFNTEEESRADTEGAISDFLSHLQNSESSKGSRKSNTQTVLQSSAETQSSRRGANSDSATSVFHSGPSSIVHPSSTSFSDRHSRKSRRQTSYRIPWIVAVVAVIAIGIGWKLAMDSDENVPQSNSDSASQSVMPVQPEATPLRITGTVVHVGSDGGFASLQEVITAFSTTENFEAVRQLTEIRLHSDLLIDETLTLKNSGFGPWPERLKITAAEGKSIVIRGSASPLIALQDVESLTLSNLTFDCSASDIGLQLSGFLSGTVIESVSFRSISSVGVQATGVSGLLNRPLVFANCQFDGSSENASAARFESSTESNIRQVEVRDCRFIGPLGKGIVLNSPQGATWDVQVVGNRFHQTRNGITFSGDDHDLQRILIANNTFYEFTRGVQFESGPDEAAAELTFIQNLFVNGQGPEVSIERIDATAEALSQGTLPPQLNWTTGAVQDSPRWLNVFRNDGRTAVEDVDFISTDPESSDFLKPRSTESGILVTSPLGRRNYIGAVAP